MREMKFRAWTGKSQRYIPRMWSWEELIEEMDTSNWRKTPLGLALAYEDPTVVNIMQYTGLKDKNGKEIYEGDIIKDFFFSNHEVVWMMQDGFNGYYAKRGINPVSFISLESLNGVDIVGNIYENPEFIS